MLPTQTPPQHGLRRPVDDTGRSVDSNQLPASDGAILMMMLIQRKCWQPRVVVEYGTEVTRGSEGTRGQTQRSTSRERREHHHFRPNSTKPQTVIWRIVQQIRQDDLLLRSNDNDRLTTTSQIVERRVVSEMLTRSAKRQQAITRHASVFTMTSQTKQQPTSIDTINHRPIPRQYPEGRPNRRSRLAVAARTIPRRTHSFAHRTRHAQPTRAKKKVTWKNKKE